MMTLKDLKDIDFDLCIDFADDEIDVTIYFELADIDDEIASQIVVAGIDKYYVTCRFTNYLRQIAETHPDKIVDYLNGAYDDGDRKDYLIQQLTKQEGDITDDGGEAVYYFITYDLEDFLINKEN